MVAWGGIEKAAHNETPCAFREVTNFSGYGPGYGRKETTDMVLGSIYEAAPSYEPTTSNGLPKNGIQYRSGGHAKFKSDHFLGSAARPNHV